MTLASTARATHVTAICDTYIFNKPIITLRHTTVKQAQLHMSVAKDELLPGLLHSIRSYLWPLDCRA